MKSKRGWTILFALPLVALSGFPTATGAQPHGSESRPSGTDRAARDPAQVRFFRAAHPCPATGRTRGPCPGWQVDHARPLCAGGEDRASNMHWLSVEDHRFKTLVDVRECRKLRKSAARPAE